MARLARIQHLAATVHSRRTTVGAPCNRRGRLGNLRVAVAAASARGDHERGGRNLRDGWGKIRRVRARRAALRRGDFQGRSRASTVRLNAQSTMCRMREPVLELTNATVRKDDTVILHGLNLRINEGEHTAILGPNGAGKSILVRLLTHEERPLPLSNGDAPARVFGDATWNVGELR